MYTHPITKVEEHGAKIVFHKGTLDDPLNTGIVPLPSIETLGSERNKEILLSIAASKRALEYTYRLLNLLLTRQGEALIFSLPTC